jgi:ribose transport system substrate-binding protein
LFHRYYEGKITGFHPLCNESSLIMKRVSLLALFLLSAFAGCGKSTTEPTASTDLRVITDSSTDPAADAKSGEQAVRIAFVTNQIADFWKLAAAGCVDAEKDLGDVEVEVRMPTQATAAEQKRIVEDLMSSGVGGFAISPVDPENQTQFLNSVMSECELITHDSDAPSSNRTMYIGMDNYAAGVQAGELVAKALPEGGQVMLFIGRLEQDNSKFRRQGVIDVLLGRTDRSQDYYRENPDALDPVDGEIKNDKYTVLGTITDQGKPEVAQSKAEDALNSYPDINAMVGLFEYNPPACYKALEKADKLGKIKLIGFDENDVTLKAIKDGYCEGTVVQNPYEYGYQSVRVLRGLMMSEPDIVPESRYLDIPPRTIGKENVDEFWADLRTKKGQ